MNTENDPPIKSRRDAWWTCGGSIIRSYSDLKLEKSGYHEDDFITDFFNRIEGLACEPAREVQVSPRYSTHYFNLTKRGQVDKIDRALRHLAVTYSLKVKRIEETRGAMFAFTIDTPEDQVAPIDMQWATDANAYDHRLCSFLGIGEGYKIVTIDLIRSPHLLIAGASGAGKSVALNVILTSLIMRNIPHQVDFLFIDPKIVELYPYKDIPHNITKGRIVSDINEVKQYLQIVIEHMDDTYTKLAKMGLRSMDDLPMDKRFDLFIVIDEFADLILADPTIEDYVARIAQKGRASGVHLIICTQRPTVQVVSGLIKANMTTRIALKTASVRDSINILDHKGAERLLGCGDAIVRFGYSPTEERVQVANIDKALTDRVCAWYQKQDEDLDFIPPDY